MLMSVMRNERLLVAQDQILTLLEQAEIPAAILKGSSVSRYYPQPDLRVLGDVDILIPIERVDQVKDMLLQMGYAFHESDHEFHLGFTRNGAYVEIHYDVTVLPDCKGGEYTALETKHFLDQVDTASVSGHRFPVLTEPHQALCLLLHMVRHTRDSGIGLRQLCDWAMFTANTDPEHFRKDIAPMLDRCGLLRYAMVATQACVRYLGLPAACAPWCADVKTADARCFMENIFSGGSLGGADTEKMGRVLSRGNIPGKKQSYLQMILAGLTKHAHYRFPITLRHRWLLPFFWIYIPLAYWVRSLLGLREKKSITAAARNAKAQQKFYEMLDIFEVSE